ncbi:MAG: hypothetical protein A3H98_07945 [Bacteroidetes bacterium RIFCSPLOWO2_02_FULL_36_8]|nr:MAG: hypothetical protein A3H98_07945 [Bacteroidetes bacterium RIFCSPLOWO2_02_FULL_36_8]OFY71747.1 MAG: hypothetical protein A3G23_13585 [Bacteroidetes bacterium RIFCSPLOWO2_12_FULL_37_12]
MQETTEDEFLSDKNKKFSVPLKYWIPTLISVISGTAILIWFVFSLINPLENDLLEVKTKGTTNFSNSPIVLNTVFLESTTGEDITYQQTLAIKNIVFRLKQRNDLVLVVGGYTDDNLDNDQFQKVTESRKASERIKNIIVGQGIEPSRIYYDGFGQNVPIRFPKTKKHNVALMVIDVFELMEGTFNGGAISSAI